MKILFVCLGNICRSPLAEALLNHKLNELGYQDRVECDSCGTSNYNLGDSPDSRTFLSARKNGVFMNHSARQLTRKDIDTFDLILAMDKNNFQTIRTLTVSKDHPKIKLMREFDPEGNGDVPDPYYGAEKDFDHVFEILDRSTQSLIEWLKSESKI